MKASLEDIPYLIILFIGVAMMAVVSHYVLGLFGAMGAVSSSGTATAAVTTTQTGLQMFDFMIVVGYILGIIVIAALASTIRTSPILLPFGILMSAFFIYIASAIKQAVTEFINVPTFATTITNFPNLLLFVSNLELIVAVSCFIILIALFAKKQIGRSLYEY